MSIFARRQPDPAPDPQPQTPGADAATDDRVAELQATIRKLEGVVADQAAQLAAMQPKVRSIPDPRPDYEIQNEHQRKVAELEQEAQERYDEQMRRVFGSLGPTPAEQAAAARGADARAARDRMRQLQRRTR